ncbi:type II toxin-antitoxin system VapC family toxin [Aurantimonas marianensis]|uniref:Ribonuclease VapC n=1 Tax=Aurantimonas marianensis TaxID=2920428 RepID=A0A9X2H562_9HYPH|nr:type II toxin-antitoxin system VapC family toxin [Aurantimonas marianensis]MCP3054028.1 type II toxin-antitoxin system VapC family toxin [Aurantimonas marianensis]
MKFLLDTNAVIAVLKGNADVFARLKRHPPDRYAISVVVAHELYYGAYRSVRVGENLARLDELRFPVLEIDPEDARQAARIRAKLAVVGLPIGPYDVLIAGQAMARSLTLVTHNRREFERVEGLRVEDWEA